MTEPTDLSPEIEQVADLLRQLRPKVRNMFRYLGAMSMADEGRAKIVRAQARTGATLFENRDECRQGVLDFASADLDGNRAADARRG